MTLSVLICLATAVLWMGIHNRGYWRGYRSETGFHAVIARPNGVEYYVDTRLPDEPEEEWDLRVPASWRSGSRDINNSSLRSNGFILGKNHAGPGLSIGIPDWFICLVTALAPTAWLTARLRRKRHRPGLCPICHYDLRATPDRCPECGMVVAQVGKNLD
jgi:hypothetical protein